jgi:hypothetical protein
MAYSGGIVEQKSRLQKAAASQEIRQSPVFNTRQK